MKKSYVYVLINTKNNKRYIGSTNDLTKRRCDHFNKLRKNKHINKILQNAWNKYGEESFIFQVIEECSIEDKLKREQYYLDTIKPEYNIATSSTAPMEGKKHTEETRKKIVEELLTRPIGVDHPLHGITWDEDRKVKWSARRKELKMEHSEETKLKMSETNKKLNRYKDLLPAIEKFKKKIEDSDGNIFESLTEAAKFHNISIPTVCDILKGRHSRTRKKKSFKYV